MTSSSENLECHQCLVLVVNDSNVDRVHQAHVRRLEALKAQLVGQRDDTFQLKVFKKLGAKTWDTQGELAAREVLAVSRKHLEKDASDSKNCALSDQHKGLRIFIKLHMLSRCVPDPGPGPTNKPKVRVLYSRLLVHQVLSVMGGPPKKEQNQRAWSKITSNKVNYRLHLKF